MVLQGLPRVDRLGTGGAGVGEGVGEVAALYVISHMVGHLVGELGAKGAEETLGAAIVLPNILDQVLRTSGPCGTRALVGGCGFIFRLNGLAQHWTRSVGGRPVVARLVDLQGPPGAAHLGTRGAGVLEGGRVVPRLAVVAHILPALVRELEAEAAGPAAALALLPHTEGEEVLRSRDRWAPCGGRQLSSHFIPVLPTHVDRQGILSSAPPLTHCTAVALDRGKVLRLQVPPCLGQVRGQLSTNIAGVASRSLGQHFSSFSL